MPRSEEQNKIIRDERREEILKYATHVFSKKGYSATKIGDVAKEASLSPGLIYHYFDSKEDMFIAVVSQSVEIANNIVDDLKSMQCDPGEKLRLLTTQILENKDICKNACRWLLMIQVSLAAAVPEAASKLFNEKFTAIGYVKSLIEEGQKSGRFSAKEDADSLTTLYWSILQGLAFFFAFNTSDNKILYKIPDVDTILKIFK